MHGETFCYCHFNLLYGQTNVRTANTGRTVLWNESNSNKWKQKIDLFYLDPLPQFFLYQ